LLTNPYHNPADTDWSTKSYKDIIEISSIEDYCVLKNSWNSCLPNVSEGMFFLMRKVGDKLIYPQWEDENNKSGGYWSFKISKNDSDRIWFELMMFMIGECITHDSSHIMEINGISISPKKNFCILKIWNRDSSLNTNNFLSNKLEFLNMKEVLYSSHESNIEKDTNKCIKKHRPNFRNKKIYTNNQPKETGFSRF